MSHKPYVNERRKGPDIWIYVLKLTALIGWLLFIGAMIVSHFAAPEKNYGVVRYHKMEQDLDWSQPLTGYLYVILWVTAVLSYLAIIINHYRSRRRTDFAFFNLFLLLFASIAWVTYLLIRLI